jgi:hypothetical protein
MLTRREAILAKVETTYNWDAAPTPADDAVLVENPSWTAEGARMIDRQAAIGTLARKKSIFGGTLMQVAFDVEAKGSGTAGVAPEIGVLLRGCAFSETINVGSSVVYQPASGGHESLTIYYYADGLLYKITGARGTVTGNFEAGNKGVFSFTFTGHLMQWGTATAGAASAITFPAAAAATDDIYNGLRIKITQGTGIGQERVISDYDGATKVATVSTAWGVTPDNTSVFSVTNGPVDKAMVNPAFVDTVPPVVMAAPFSVGSYKAAINALSIDFGISMATPASIESPDGYSAIYLTERNVTGTFDPEAVLTATHDYMENWRTVQSLPLTTGVIGSAAGNRYKIDMPAIYYRELSPGDRDGLRTFEVGYAAEEVSGDDEVIITFE